MVKEDRVAMQRAFVAQMNALRARVGSPTLQELCRLSETLPAPEGLPGGSARHVLAKSTLHDLLNGKRVRMPTWPLVSSFVQACRAVAEQIGMDTAGLEDLEVWRTRWLAARAGRILAPADAPHANAVTVSTAPALTSRPAGVPVSRPTRVPQDLPALSLAHPAAVSPGVTRDSPLSVLAQPAPHDLHLTLSSLSGGPAADDEPRAEQLRHQLQVYGRTGLRLLREADADDGQAHMRLAVIALLRGHPDEALRRLRRANDAGHYEASGLFYHPCRAQIAAELAYQYGHGYQEADPPRLPLARFFYRLAAEAGHVKAAYLLGRLHEDSGEQSQAAAWFRKAARDAPLDPPAPP